MAQVEFQSKKKVKAGKQQRSTFWPNKSKQSAGNKPNSPQTTKHDMPMKHAKRMMD